MNKKDRPLELEIMQAEVRVCNVFPKHISEDGISKEVICIHSVLSYIIFTTDSRYKTETEKLILS